MFLGSVGDIIIGLASCTCYEISIVSVVFVAVKYWLVDVCYKFMFGLGSTVLLLNENVVLQSVVFGVE
jgi:hypothetical protein